MHLSSLCPVDSPLWQRVVDDLCQTRVVTQCIPPPLPSAPAAHQRQDRVTNTEVLERAGSMSMPSLLIQRHLRWPGHAHRMEPDLPAKRNPLWTTVGGRPSRGLTAAALQGRHQARVAIYTNRHQCMGGHRQSPRYMAAKWGFQRLK